MSKKAADWNKDYVEGDTLIAEKPAPEPSPPVEEPVEVPKKEFQTVDNARFYVVADNSLYPFSELAVGQGFFAPLEANEDMDKFVVDMNKQARQYSIANSQVEHNEEGDEILENYTVNARLRNPDGTFKLDGEGVPKISISSGLRPKLIGPRFAVRAVHKDDEMSENVKTDADGVLVIRLD